MDAPCPGADASVAPTESMDPQLRWLLGYCRYRLHRVLRKPREGYGVIWARREGVKVGTGCRFLGTHAGTFSTEPWLISIGNHVSITSVQFITHDGGVWVFRRQWPDIEHFGRIRIGNNVFIGYRAVLLPGTIIGQDSIIAAGAVVKGSFADGQVLGGVPARVLCSVADYLERNRSGFVHVRSLHKSEKRAAVEKAIGPGT